MFLLSFLLFFAAIETPSEMNEALWFQTWSQDDYQEWATKIPEGYALLIISQNQNNYVAIRATMSLRRGVPALQIIEQHSFPDYDDAEMRVGSWREQLPRTR